MIVTVWEDPSFTISLETNKHGIVFAHCEVSKYSPSVKKKLQEAWSIVLKRLKNKEIPAVFVSCSPENKTRVKFFEMFGFENTGIIVEHGNIIFRILL